MRGCPENLECPGKTTACAPVHSGRATAWFLACRDGAPLPNTRPRTLSPKSCASAAPAAFFRMPLSLLSPLTCSDPALRGPGAVGIGEGGVTALLGGGLSGGEGDRVGKGGVWRAGTCGEGGGEGPVEAGFAAWVPGREAFSELDGWSTFLSPCDACLCCSPSLISSSAAAGKAGAGPVALFTV